MSKEVFSTLGKSKRSFIQIEDIDLAVKDIRKNFYSADEFSELIQNIQTMDSLNTTSSNELVDYKSFIENEIQDIRTEKFLNLLFSNLKSLTSYFVEFGLKKVMNDHGSLFLDKDNYFSIQYNCLKSKARDSDFTGCVFERLFFPVVRNHLKQFNFSENQLSTLWRTLGTGKAH